MNFGIISLKMLKKIGRLGGSVGQASDSWAQSREHKPHVELHAGCETYLKKKKKKNSKNTREKPQTFKNTQNYLQKNESVCGFFNKWV